MLQATKEKGVKCSQRSSSKAAVSCRTRIFIGKASKELGREGRQGWSLERENEERRIVVEAKHTHTEGFLNSRVRQRAQLLGEAQQRGP